MENQIDCSGVVLNIQPIADILTLPVNRQRFSMADIVNKQRYQFLRELIRSIIIRTVGHDGRHSISIMIGTHEMVTRGLGCRIRAMRVILRCLIEELLTIGQMVLRR